jgi:hypothetical protein
VKADGELPPWERDSSKALARLATDESVVLLKNEGQYAAAQPRQAEDHCRDRSLGRPGAAGLVQRNAAVYGERAGRDS